MTNQQSASDRTRTGSIEVCVRDGGGDMHVLAGALIGLYEADSGGNTFNALNWDKNRTPLIIKPQETDERGRTLFEGLDAGTYIVAYEHYPKTPAQCVEVKAGCTVDVCFKLNLNVQTVLTFKTVDCGDLPCGEPRVGDRVNVKIEFTDDTNLSQFVAVTAPPGFKRVQGKRNEFMTRIRSSGPAVFPFTLAFSAQDPANPQKAMMEAPAEVDAEEQPTQAVTGKIEATLDRTTTQFTDDVAFWNGILNSTETLSFNTYLKFMDYLFCGQSDLSSLSRYEQDRFDHKRAKYGVLRNNRFLPFTDTDAYRVVKAATEAFVMVNCGVLERGVLEGDKPIGAFDSVRDKDYLEKRGIPIPLKDLLTVFSDDYLEKVNGTSTLPYLAIIRRKLPDIGIKALPFEEATPGQGDECYGILQEKLTYPCLMELIWSYWHEEGMLAQTTKAIARRFQNVRSANPQDPLSNQEIDPLRPLNNLIWGHIQDEQHRLTVVRRNYEYDHHYGLRLQGKAVQEFRPADTRSKFLEAFHNLLRLCTGFYKQDDDTTVKADAFPVLNALKEVHLILSQGAHNQFGDLTSTARIEMMMEQWLLARPEFREFLPTRIMVAYPEPWMDRVDAMKKLQGWTDTSVLHFRNLGVFGEQILLSVRYGAWSVVYEPLQAFNWARFWRPQVQGYVHAYRAATGVDLAAENTDSQVEATLPSILLQKRLAMQQRGA
jgi:hypothetical protein